MSRRNELENRLIDYGISLSTAEVAKVMGCHERTIWQLQRMGVIKSFIVDSNSKKKRRKTMKEDLIDYLLKQEGVEHVNN